MLGLIQVAMSFAKAGNAEVVANNVGALNTALNALLNKINSPGFINQNINVQVDTQRRVSVTGLEALQGAVRQVFEQRIGSLVDKQEQAAINDIVQSLVLRLNELGIVNSGGI